MWGAGRHATKFGMQLAFFGGDHQLFRAGVETMKTLFDAMRLV
jgi:hypothetical protein